MNFTRLRLLLFHLFAIILPATLALNQLCLVLVQWKSSYGMNGMTFEPRGVLLGFPLPIAGTFIKLNPDCPICMTVNWTNYFLNWLIAFAAVVLLWYLIRKEIKFSSWMGYFAVSAIAVVVYLAGGYMLLILHDVALDYQGGVWPDNLELHGLTGPF